MDIAKIIFYVNIALMFCVAAEFVALVFSCKKTAYKRAVRIAATAATGAGLLMSVVMIAAYVVGMKNFAAAVYAALAVSVIGLIATGIYCLTLSRRSDRAFATAAGIFAILPPIGMFLAVKLLLCMREDTRAENLVYRRKGYTFAALTALYRGANESTDFVDTSDQEEFEELSRADAKKYLKSLKKDSRTPEGCFKYAEALLKYSPKDAQYAVKLTEKAAKRGCADAMFNLGYFCETGVFGVKKDVKRARILYKRAADAGDPDAVLRLGILDVKTNKATDGADIFKERAESDDAARFDLALCYERGSGAACDIEKAIELYAACAVNGMDAAIDRLIAFGAEYAATRRDDLKKLDGIEYNGAFGDIMNGFKEIRGRRAPEAAESFLAAVKKRDKREGVARLFVGTLYLDCGALERDRRNGAAYIKSASSKTSIAAEIYGCIPKRLKTEVDEAHEREYQKKHERDSEQIKASANAADEERIVERDSISNTESFENF